VCNMGHVNGPAAPYTCARATFYGSAALKQQRLHSEEQGGACGSASAALKPSTCLHRTGQPHPEGGSPPSRTHCAVVPQADGPHMCGEGGPHLRHPLCRAPASAPAGPAA
jgi:hypothetical protein